MSRPLCILIHGFTGNSSEVSPLAEALSLSGYDVVTPLLPGHHHTNEPMSKIQASDWIHAIEQLTERAVNEQRTIHLIGFSMGAMIAAILGCRHSIRTLVFLSPPVYVATPSVLFRRYKQMRKLKRDNPSLLKKTIHDTLNSLRCAPLHNILQFKKVVQDGKKALPHLNMPICIIHGLQDDVVDPKSSEWIYTKILSQDKELHLLSRSGHLLCHDVEATPLVQRVTCFLKKYG